MSSAVVFSSTVEVSPFPAIGRPSVHESSAVTTYLFTDIEGSTRLWEQAPQRMQDALARHDAIAQRCVVDCSGSVVKSTGDGMLAVFADPLDALRATVQLQRALADPAATNGITLRVRCGLHAGVDARRDNDYFGNAVNRAARVMSAAHGGQILLTQAVAALLGSRLPEGVALLDLGRVRLRDLAQPERIHQVMHPTLRQQFPALRSLEATPNNLPQQLTSFVGRERELVDVRKQLAETRLLTLLGGGGLGKTRLSLQVAANALDAFPDGAWLVELAPINDPRLVPQAVASVLGVKEEPGLPVIDALLKFVGDRHLLLILDNCEHLVQACAELAKCLLGAGPGATILVSSRESLNVGGERIYPLAPLAAPASATTIDVAAIAAFPAVQLFVDRATAAQPAFRITDDNAAAVAEVCRRLDGIPLALELAAARLRSMPVERIAQRLSDRFRLLTGGDRTALPRQQTLRALIDWSYDLLEESERALFRRLAAFVGGFTLDAAEKIGAGGEDGEVDVLDLLARLVEKSLVTMEAVGDRYRMLETVREYAGERLDASAERDAVRARHLDHFLALAERARLELIGPNQRVWLAQLDVERENIIAAHTCCNHATDGGVLGLRLVRAMRTYCIQRGLLALGYGATIEALARPGAQTREFTRCRVLADAGQFAIAMGRYQEALLHLTESLAIAHELGDRSRVAVALQPLGRAYLALGEPDKAQASLEEALAMAREICDQREIAAALSSLAQLSRVQRDFAAAQARNEECLAIVRKLEDEESVAITWLNLAMVAILQDSCERARDALRQAVVIVTETGSRPSGQSVIEVTAGLAAAGGHWLAAAQFFGAAEREAESSGLKRDPSDEAFLTEQMAKVHQALGQEEFARAEIAGRDFPMSGQWAKPANG